MLHGRVGRAGRYAQQFDPDDREVGDSRNSVDHLDAIVNDPDAALVGCAEHLGPVGAERCDRDEPPAMKVRDERRLELGRDDVGVPVLLELDPPVLGRQLEPPVARCLLLTPAK